MMVDRLQYLIAFEIKEELQRHVANAIEFIEKRSEAVIVQADHIPIWLRLGSRKALFVAWERFTKASNISRTGTARYKRTK